MARTGAKSKTIDLTSLPSTINFWFSGQTETDGVIDSDHKVAGSTALQAKRSFPAPAGSGWSIWVIGDTTATAGDLTLTTTELDDEGNVAAGTTTVWGAETLSNSIVLHESLGSLDRCFGIQVVPTMGGVPAGDLTIKVIYETHD